MLIEHAFMAIVSEEPLQPNIEIFGNKPEGIEVLPGFDSKKAEKIFTERIKSLSQETPEVMLIAPISGSLTAVVLALQSQQLSVTYALINNGQNKFMQVHPESISLPRVLVDGIIDTGATYNKLVGEGIHLQNTIAITRKIGTPKYIPGVSNTPLLPNIEIEGQSVEPWILSGFGMDSGVWKFMITQDPTNAEKYARLTALERNCSLILYEKNNSIMERVVAGTFDIEGYQNFLELNQKLDGKFGKKYIEHLTEVNLLPTPQEKLQATVNFHRLYLCGPLFSES